MKNEEIEESSSEQTNSEAEDVIEEGTEDARTDQDLIEELTREKDQFRALAQRAQADLVNYRNRASQEMEESRRIVKFGVISKFLNVADDLERAIGNIPSDMDENWSEGIILVLRGLENSLTLEGVEKIDALGESFDPHFHEALMYEERSDTEEGIIVDVIQTGYKIKDRVLRPARVVGAQSDLKDKKQTNKKADESQEEE